MTYEARSMLHGSAVRIWRWQDMQKAVRNALVVIEEGIETAKEPGRSIPTSKGMHVKEHIDDGIMQNLLHLVPRSHIGM